MVRSNKCYLLGRRYSVQTHKNILFPKPHASRRRATLGPRIAAGTARIVGRTGAAGEGIFNEGTLCTGIFTSLSSSSIIITSSSNSSFFFTDVDFGPKNEEEYEEEEEEDIFVTGAMNVLKRT